MELAYRPVMLSADDHAEFVARYGELVRGLRRLLDALRPEARSPKPQAYESQTLPGGCAAPGLDLSPISG